MARFRYAKGKKSLAISDRSGLRVPYTQLKTTWDGLRVSPEDWEPKQPQLTPAKNVVDATALFSPRPDNDPENAEVFIGFNYDIFVDRRLTTNVGVAGTSFVGSSTFEVQNTSQAGVGGTGAAGQVSLFVTIDYAATGVGSTGGVATDSASYLEYAITVGAIAAGNRYYVDSVLQQRLYLQEGQTYRFDQSASSNNGHPLRFSTTSNGTHAGGSQYTTGVTTSGTPGNAGAYTQITVASGAPTLYYYCTNHNYMGGTSYTPAAGTITLITTVVGGNPSNHPYHNVGSSNKYAIDGSTATSDVTLLLTEGSTYRFDQSASSNSGHPLRFSTTANGTHAGGSEYTTGVTTSGAPGQANSYTQITVAAGAPTLYYYCTNHSSMGWTAKTPALTSSGGTVPVEIEKLPAGLGGTGAAGNQSVEGSPTALGTGGTGNVGSSQYVEAFGWGQGAWSQGAWGDSEGSPHVLGAAGGVGGVGVVQPYLITTWGEDGWGTGQWNANIKPVITDAAGGVGGVGVAQALVETSWGESTWDSGQWN